MACICENLRFLICVAKVSVILGYDAGSQGSPVPIFRSNLIHIQGSVEPFAVIDK